MDKIELLRSKDKENINKYCHNDYDLATISSYNNFGIKKDIILLESYFGVFNKEHLNTLNDMKFICMLREVALALMHEGMNIKKINHNMNYYEFANYVLNKLNQGLVTL